MKTLLKRTAALLLAAAMCLPLAGCSKKTVDDSAGVIATIGDREIRSDEFVYYLLPYKEYYLSNDADYFKKDPTRAAAIFSELITAFSYDNALFVWAAENGVALTEAELAEIDAAFELEVSNAGGEAAFKKLIAADNKTPRLYKELMVQDALIVKIREFVYSDASPIAATDEEVAAYIDENGMLGAKHILVMFTGDPEADRIKAEGILAELRAGADFDELMFQYSDDPGLEGSPDGYTFGPGKMVEEFENGTKELAVGEISGLIESSYGYHIIMRVEPDLETVRSELETQRLREISAQYAANTPIVYCDDYGDITIDDIEFKGEK